mmetsp:Transcript_26727/g.48540  ORF Transcript_26727/g.48540 Transcript_26727/m.48540 type:complete len:432 (-) Transcript_26727:138-1433(-)
MKTSLLDRVGDPVGLIIVFDESVTDFLHLDKPRWDSLVDKRSIRTPAKGIGVIQIILLHQPPSFLNQLNKGIIGLFDVNALDGLYGVGKQSIGIHRTWNVLALKNNFVGQTDTIIIFSKGRCLMDNTSTGVVSHVGIRKDLKVVSRLGCVCEKVKERFVPLSHQVCSHQGRLDLIRFGSHGRLPLLLVIHDGIELCQARFCQNVLLHCLLVLNMNVLQFGMDTERQVGWKGPRGRCPCHKGDFGIIHKREADHNRRIANVLVVQAGFKVTEWSGAGRGKGHDLVPLVDQTFFKELGKDPPHAFHEVWVHGFVVVLKVNPAAEPCDRRFPFLSVAGDNGATGRIVLVNAHFQHLISVRNVEFLINLVLHWKAVAIPASPPLHLLSRHGCIPRHNILNRTRQNMSVMRKPRRKRRSIVKRKLLIASLFAESVL